MEGQIEAAGALATAAGVAAVLEPAKARAPGGGDTCLNCGATVAGKFCGRCGQVAHVHRSIGHAVEELLHGVWHFDSKLWRTLPMLVVQPGTLTRDYVMGKRARYISPFALFLLTIFLMFFVFGFSGGMQFSGPDTGVKVRADAAAPSQVRTPPSEAQIAARVAEIDRTIASVEADIANVEEGPGQTGEIAGLRAAREAMLRSRERARNPASQTATVVEEAEWVTMLKAAAANGEDSFNLGNEALNAKARRALGNPELALYKVQQKGYKLSFLLLPMSLPWMLLLFAWKRDVRTYDHVVFLLYSISFMSFLVMIGVGLSLAGMTAPIIYALLIGVAPPVHMFVQMKGAYLLSTGSALWRTFALAMMSILTLALYFALIVALGLVE